MKKILFILILLMNILLITNVNAFDTSQKIYDYADLLIDSEEKMLKEKVDEYIKKYNMDMVLVTVNEHDKTSTQAYADDFYDYNGFGIGSSHDGVILVIDNNFEKENIQMETTGKAIKVYTDTKIDSILDDVYTEYDYYELFNLFIKDASKYAERHFPFFIAFAVSALVASIVLGILVAKNKMVKIATEANTYMDKDSAKITERNDQFVTTHTTSVRINTSSGSGGSSTHTGSSGISHGGGGRSR